MEALLAEIPGLPSLKAVNNPMPSKYAFMSNPELLSGEDIDTYRVSRNVHVHSIHVHWLIYSDFILA